MQQEVHALLVFVSLPANLTELTRFVCYNDGLIISDGAYLMPWDGTPDALSRAVCDMVPKTTKIVVAGITDYWHLSA